MGGKSTKRTDQGKRVLPADARADKAKPISLTHTHPPLMSTKDDFLRIR